jgi:hypothetical protein
MRYTVFMIGSLAAALLTFSPTAFGQKLVIGKEPGTEVPEVTAGPGWKTCPRCQNNGHIQAAKEKYKVNGHPFDPHDFSGIWGNNGIPFDFKTVPSFTPYGKKLWEATQAEVAHPGVPATNGGAGGKDPMMHCDPLGYPRSVEYSYGMEFVMLPDRVLQFFEFGGYSRTIWTDGRKLPADPPQARWFGYNVGHWEGDTLVIESNGYEDRSWIDEDRPGGRQRGMPHSDEMKIVERWKRPNYGTLELEMTIIDPKVYTKPWVSKGTTDLRPGTELSEYYCVPSDSEQYNKELTR